MRFENGGWFLEIDGGEWCKSLVEGGLKRVFVITRVSTSPRVSSYLVKAYQIYLCCCKDWKLLLRDVAASFDSAVHRVHAVSLDAAVASTVSAACCVAAGYIVSAGLYCCCLLCSCCFSILFLREDPSRNLELTESKPSLGEDCWNLLKTTNSSSIPADYVSAGHVLVYADRDRIC
ncbi:hypothetical protein Tco_0953754 [Tanacetum coccineum]|uniref:Uncharacterized protein n=1 Tax=Tanacetum coccineum TaxID=301880 RepID=A0ABQ5E498_9ASTR